MSETNDENKPAPATPPAADPTPPPPAAAPIDAETTSATKTVTLTEAELEALVRERLKPIKGNLDNAFAERDAALAKAEAFEKKERDAEIARLTEEGKHKEAYEIQLAERDSKIAALSKRTTELSRDNELSAVLGSYTFRNEAAADMMRSKVLAELVQQDDGNWAHKSGVSIRDYVKVFSANEDNAFLFKQKTSSGTGSHGASPTPGTSTKTSIFDMTQDEVLTHIAEGKPLPRRG